MVSGIRVRKTSQVAYPYATRRNDSEVEPRTRTCSPAAAEVADTERVLPRHSVRKATDTWESTGEAALRMKRRVAARKEPQRHRPVLDTWGTACTRRFIERNMAGTRAVGFRELAEDVGTRTAR